MLRLTSLLALLLPLPMTVGAMAFTDVADSYPYAEAIEYVKAQNIVGGYEDGTYKPDNNINRVEFVKIIVGATTDTATIEGCYTDDLTYTDTDNEVWYAPYLCTATKAGLVEGYDDNTFKPAQNINFVEASKIITLAMGYETTVGAEWFTGYVQALAERGAVPSVTTGPAMKVTRGMMAEMIYRLKTETQTAGALSYEDLMAVADQAVTDDEYTDEMITEEEMFITQMEEMLAEETNMEADLESEDQILDQLEADIEALLEELAGGETMQDEAADDVADDTTDETTDDETTDDETADETTDNSAADAADDTTDDSADDAASDATDDTANTAAGNGVYAEYTAEAYSDLQASGAKFGLFFHAPWCPSCVALDNELQAYGELIPSGTTVLKIDYDTAPVTMKSDYGVTMQHTLVVFDTDGTYDQTVLSVTGDQIAQYLQ